MTQVSILREDNEAVITVSVPGDPKSPYVARDDHPNFKAMVASVVSGDLDDITDLFNVADTIATKFERLSERVTVENGNVMFDGVAVDSALTQHILDVLHEGATDASWTALVNFFEKVQTNPDERSREQLYNWIKAQDGLTITEAGDMVGYKYVVPCEVHGYKSSSSGREPVRVSFADGTSEVFTGQIPNALDSLVEMPRDLVDSDPNRTCSVGLHVGAWNYVKGQEIILEVHVNPRDVVAVPSDYNGEKVRACRYWVVDTVDDKYGQAVKLDGDTPKPDTRDDEYNSLDLDVTLAPLRDKEPDTIHGFPVGAKVRAIKNPGNAGIGATGTIDPDVSTQAGHTGFMLNGLALLPIRWDEGTSFQMDGDYYASYFELVEPEFAEGDRVEDSEGDEGTIVLNQYDNLAVVYDDYDLGTFPLLELQDEGYEFEVTDSSGRTHGKGGSTSEAAKGRGKNPAQDALGRFSAGRPGSQRDPKTGRFAG